jgi:hypothetical protein
MLMKKLKILWRNRNTWNFAFNHWKILMFPHLYYRPEKNADWWDSWWFWESLNNFDNEFDEDT